MSSVVNETKQQLWQLYLDWMMLAWVEEGNPRPRHPQDRSATIGAYVFRKCAEELRDVLEGRGYEAEADETDLDNVSLKDALEYIKRNFK